MTNNSPRARHLASTLVLAVLAQSASAAGYPVGDASSLVAAIEDANATAALDACGNTAQASAIVTVPKSQAGH
jgi:parvulin-like peptidyl-prolyl isomerase